jgi:hypothetical protein
MQCRSLVPLCPAIPLLPLHLPVGGVHDEQVGAGIPHLVYLLLSLYHLTPGLWCCPHWCCPHWAVQFAVCLVVAMVHVPVLEFMLDVHQSTPIYNVYQSA